MARESDDPKPTFPRSKRRGDVLEHNRLDSIPAGWNPSLAEVRNDTADHRRQASVEALMRWPLVVSILLALLQPCASRAQDEPVDKEIYHLAVEYCRGTVPRPMALSSDRRILCFDGWVEKDMDVSLARDLGEGGLFVARSLGGDIASAIALSDLLRERAATVVIYDFCLSACADYIFIASHRTYVLKGSLVAWHVSIIGPRDCVSLKVPRDMGPKKIQQLSCGTDPLDYPLKLKQALSAAVRFNKERAVDPSFEPPADSFHVRTALKNLYEQTGVLPDVWWTLNPRYYRAFFKTKIDYEAYPESQAEVDEMAARLRLPRVIYDP